MSRFKPNPVTVINGVARARERLGFSPATLEVNDLLLSARRAALLDDYGEGSFREGLDVLVASLNDEADLSPMGVMIMKQMLVGILASRLRVRHYQKRNEALEYETVQAPLIVCGLPRTGTTLLSHLLALDPANRPLTGWEAGDPAPPPTLADRLTDPRRVKAISGHSNFSRLAPELQAMHETDPDLPTECVGLFAGSFRSIHFETLAHIPSYGRWLQQTDLAPAYAHHELQLKILQSTVPTQRWSLKTPMHLWHLDAVRAVYPDARMVWCHRDPVKVINSVSSLVTALHAVASEHRRPETVGADWLDKAVHAVGAGTEARAHWDPEQWFDLQYAEFMEGPVGSIERMYAHFDLELPEYVRRRMELWMADRPQHRLGRHRYTLDAFGLDEGEITERFAHYVATYQVPRERPSN